MYNKHSISSICLNALINNNNIMIFKSYLIFSSLPKMYFFKTVGEGYDGSYMKNVI